MKPSVIAITLMAVFSTITLAAHAEDSGRIIQKQNIGEICNSKPITHRRTVVYVDLSSIKKDEKEWGLTILNKLALAPRETVSILGVNPSTFEVSEVFNSCYPILTKSEIEKARTYRGLWQELTTSGPEAQQRENIETFNLQIRNALNKLVDAASKLSLGRRRDILGAVAIDKNRFEDRHAFYRLIIYTNGEIVEPGTSKTESKDKLIRLLNEKYSTNFSGADVYVYGVVGGGTDRPLEAKASIFSAYFLNNWGWLHSFSPSLPPQQDKPIRPVVRMDGSFQGGGTQGSAKLSFTTAEDRDLRQAWLAFVVGAKTLYVPFEGQYSCRNGSCTLRATCVDNVPAGSDTPYFRKGDKLALSGKTDGDLKGSLRPAAPEVFKVSSKEEANPDAKGSHKGEGERVDYVLTMRRN